MAVHSVDAGGGEEGKKVGGDQSNHWGGVGDVGNEVNSGPCDWEGKAGKKVRAQGKKSERQLPRGRQCSLLRGGSKFFVGV